LQCEAAWILPKAETLDVSTLRSGENRSPDLF
jgi:hypothetical protein